MFHHHLLSPGGYSKVELIHSTCVLCMGVYVSWCMSRGSRGSSAQHVPRKFCHHLREEWRRAARRTGRGETDGGISGEGRPIKREGRRGNMRDRMNMGGTYRVEERGWNFPGEDVKKLSLLGFAPQTEILAYVHWTCLLRACSIYHSVSNTFSPYSVASSLIHLSEVLKGALGQVRTHTLIIRLWIALFAKCNKWTRICFSVETVGETGQQIMN